jgi:hypothetical protein
MIRWSVHWELAGFTRPAEIARIMGLMPDLLPYEALVLAKNKSRSHRIKPLAIDHIRSLKANPGVAEIRLYRIEPWRLHDLWIRPATPEPAIPAAEAAAIPAMPYLPNCHPGRTHTFKPYNSSCEICAHCGVVHELHWKDPRPTTDMKFHATPEEETVSPAIPRPAPEPTFAFRSFQSDDMARAALQPGALLGWEPGLGKTMPAFSMPFIWRARTSLIVVQADLHQQLIDEGLAKFGVTVRVIDSQATALRYMREGILPYPGMADRSPLPDGSMPAYFITAYNWLGYNGGDEWQPDTPTELLRLRRLTLIRQLCPPEIESVAAFVSRRDYRPTHLQTPWEILGIPAGSPMPVIKSAWRTVARLFHPDLHPEDPHATARFQLANAAWEKLTGKDERNFDARLAEFHRESPGFAAVILTIHEIEAGIGTTVSGIKCVFTPTLASILADTFDCVVCDEAVAIKSGTAHAAEGVLRMAPRYRLALTGTPIKNKFPDFFFLGSWVAGFHDTPTTRWPYPGTPEGRAQFAADFGVMEENLTKAEKAATKGEHGKRFTKTDPTEICNIHRLWRIFGTVLIRRRKDDIPGCDIVAKKIIPVHVMPGTRQKQVYAHHVSHPTPYDSLLATLGAQLTCLRQAALFPASPNLRQRDIAGSVSTHPFTPKTAAILQLATDLMAQGEQLVVFSPFIDFSTHLAGVLSSAGVPHLQLDGTMSPQKRGLLIKQFKSGQAPILIAGIKGMASGHNLDNCHNLILPGLDWALDLNRQAIDRVHRLTSRKDVSIYILITKGTSDERLADLWQVKGNSADLALDGRLIQENREKVDLVRFMREAVADFDPTAATLCEDEITRRWEATGAAAIRDSFTTYRRLRPEPPRPAAKSTTRPLDRPLTPPHPDKPLVPAHPVLTRPTPTATTPVTPAPAILTPARSLFDLMRKNRQAAIQAATTAAPVPRPPSIRPILPLFKPSTAPPKTPPKRRPLQLP